jgi:cell division protein FtsL
MGGVGALLYILVTIFLLIAAILAILMPFFVLRIRNELIEMNQKISQMVEILGGKDAVIAQLEPATVLKTCPSCGADNRQEDYMCIRCGKPLP